MWLRIREYYKSSFRLNLSLLDIFKAYSGGVIPFISFSSLDKYIAHFTPIHKCPNRQTNLCNVSSLQQIYSQYDDCMEANLKILYWPKLSWIGYYISSSTGGGRWTCAGVAPAAQSGAASSVCCVWIGILETPAGPANKYRVSQKKVGSQKTWP